MLKIVKMLAVLVAVLAMYTPASAQWTETKFMSDDIAGGDQLGSWAVSISDGVGLTVSPAKGAAYLFDVATGNQLHKLEPSVASEGSFGGGSSIDGNLAVVPDRAGNRTFLFDVTTGSELGVIENPDAGGANIGFGGGSTISGNTVVISAQWAKDLYVYDVSDMVANPGTGSAVALGTGPIHRDGYFAMNNIALSGDTLVAGETNTGPNWFGSAYVYDLSVLGPGTGTVTEVQLDPLYTQNGGEQLMLGTSVDIEDGIAIVGAPLAGDDSGGALWNAGMAFLFDVSDPSAPTKLAEIVPDDRQGEHRFGSDVGVSGDTVIVGGSTRYAPGGTWNTPGEAYLFDISDTNNISQIQKMTTGDNMSVDMYGVPVAIEDGVALVTASKDDEAAGDAGAVYIYTAPPAALTWDGGIGNWADSNWSGGSEPTAEMGMVVNADTDDSVVTVAADFITGGTGPAASVFVGEEYAAKLVVTSGATLEVTGETTAGEFGKIAVENAATLQTGSAVIEIDGRLIAGVQGSTGDSGLVDSAGQMTIEDADAIQVDWMPGTDAGSMFGGTYTVAQYTGTALATTGTTANEDANIGAGYIKSVDYAADLGGGILGVNVELQPQGFGDTDLDADVDGDDLATFGLAWAPSGTDKTWFDGDFDFDGDIDGDDLAALGLAWAPSGIDFPAGDLEVTAVPEPGSIIMLLIGAAGLLIYRKRR